MAGADSHLTIDGPDSLSPAMDYRALRRVGLDAVIQSGSDTWTDYNEHDPGITILEALSYALTDLAYRTEFPIEDIIAQQQLSADELKSRQFYSARDILTTNPVTIEDLRKLVIDIHGVGNCDVVPWTPPGNPVGGLLSVVIDPSPDTAESLAPSGEFKLTLSDAMKPLLTSALEDWDDQAPMNSDFIRTLAWMWGIPAMVAEDLVGVMFRLREQPRRMTPVKQALQVLRQPPFGAGPETIRAVIVRSFRSAFFDAGGALPWLPVNLRRAIEGIDASEKTRQALLAEIRQTWSRHRNIGQDLAGVFIRTPVKIAVELSGVTLDYGADLESTLAAVFNTLAQVFNPPAQFLSLDQMMELEQGNVNEVFNGPPLLHGFLPGQALQPLPSRLRATEIMPLIQKTPGVQLISSLRFALADLAPGAKPEWEKDLSLAPLQRPVLADFQQNRITPAPNLEKLTFDYQNIRQQQPASKLVEQERDLPLPTGAYRDLEHYTSVQFELPRLYGVQPHGLPPDADDTRRAEAKQLQAYLLIFDQIMADYLAQLAQVGQLFSWSEEVKRTYFFQGLEHAFKDVTALLQGCPLADHDLESHACREAIEQYRQRLAEYREDPATFVRRRNEFLDHLLVRFGRDLEAGCQRIIQWPDGEAGMQAKLRILANYRELSRDRARAYVRGDEATGTPSVYSGVRRWLEADFDLETETPEVRQFVRRFVEVSLTPDVTRHLPMARFVLKTKTGAPIDLDEIMRIGMVEANYQVDVRSKPKPEDDGEPVGAPSAESEPLFPRNVGLEHVLVLYQTGSPPPGQAYEVAQSFRLSSDAFRARDELIRLLRQYDRASEHVYLVEHGLLRPRPDDPVFGLRLLNADGEPWLQSTEPGIQAKFNQILQPPCEAIYYSIANETKTERYSANCDRPYDIEAIPEEQDLAPGALRHEFKLTTDPAGRVTVSLQLRATENIEFEGAQAFADELLATQAINRWMRRLAQGQPERELWQAFSEPFAPAEGLSFPAELGGDPYSYIVTAVIPTWPTRFQEPVFREQMLARLREELPAHLWLNVLWLNKPWFQRYLVLYQRWWEAYTTPAVNPRWQARALMEFLLYHSSVPASAPDDNR